LKIQELGQLKQQLLDNRTTNLEQREAEVREACVTIERLSKSLEVIANIWSYVRSVI